MFPRAIAGRKRPSGKKDSVCVFGILSAAVADVDFYFPHAPTVERHEAITVVTTAAALRSERR